MSDYSEFIGRIETFEWGKATCTFVPLPDEVAERMSCEGAKHVTEHPVNLAPVRAPVLDRTFLRTDKSLLDRIGAAPDTRDRRIERLAGDLGRNA